MTKDEHNAAAVHLLEAMSRGGGMSDRIRRLLESLVAPGEPDGPNVGALFAFADAGNARALLTLFSGWQRHGIPDALDRWRMERAEIAAEREKLENVPVTTPIPMDPLKFPAGITEKVYIEHKFNLIS